MARHHSADLRTGEQCLKLFPNIFDCGAFCFRKFGQLAINARWTADYVE